MSLSTLEFLLNQAYSAIRRNALMTLGSITNVAVSLGILGLFALAAANLDYMARQQTRQAVIKVFLYDNANKDRVIEAALALKDEQGRFCVPQNGVQYVDKNAALREAAGMLGVNQTDLMPISGNPLPRSIRLKPAHAEQIETIAAAMEKLEGVRQVQYRQEVTRKLLAVARAVKIAGLAFFVLLTLGMVLIINTTIRLTIYARRREIRIMQLVGATNWFIRVPFMLEGVLQGFVGGALAAGLTLLLYLNVMQYVDTRLQFIHLLYGTGMYVSFGLGLVVFGVLLGAAGSLTGLRKYLALA